MSFAYFSGMGRIISVFCLGVLVLVPLAVTVYGIMTAFHFIENSIDTLLLLLPVRYHDTIHIMVMPKVGALFIVAATLFACGLLVRRMTEKYTVLVNDSLFKNRRAGSKNIAVSLQQIIKSVNSKKRSSFSNPVLVEYPSSGIWVIAFAAQTAQYIYSDEKGKVYTTVFIPVIPDPTTGFMVFMPVDKVKPLNMSVDDAMQMVLTGGKVKLK